MLKLTSVRLPSSAKLSTLSISLLRCGSFFCAAEELKRKKLVNYMTK